MSFANRVEQRTWLPMLMLLNPSGELSILDRGAIAILKKGERGHPCLIPFVKKIVSEVKLGVTSHAIGDAYMCRKNCMTGPEKLKSSITLNSQDKLMLLKAFSA